jgi:lipid-A-disaccharide synthase
LRVFVSAGEASGDLHGASLVRELRALDPSIRIEGYGGPRLRAAGQDQWLDLTAFAVMGLVAVVRHAKSLLALLRRTRERLEADPPDLVVLIDYPGLHFQIAKIAKRLGIPVLYYIIPQFWAWGAWRIGKLQRRTDHALVILPFEPAFYAERGVDVEYVGHPVLDHLERHRTDPAFERAAIAVPRPRLGLLPGSRVQEIEKLLPTMLAIAARARERVPALSIVTSLPSDPARHAAFERFLAASPAPVTSLPDDPHGLMKSCDVCLVASGTATLELACVGTPMVVLYRVSPFAKTMAPLLLRTPSIGLVNVVAGRRIVPEYLFAREPIAEAADDVVDMLANPERAGAIRRDLARVREALGEAGASARTAAAVLRFAQKRRASRSPLPSPAR